ncbi:MAG: ScyD/ScyE family protein [Chloroflexota bacterium]|nr:ScyD/ScyE family protein [Chloroflexota bacterium]
MYRRRVPAVLSAILLVSILLPAGAAAADPHWRTVARGLNNPRGVAVDSAGRVYVAEAGKGGSGRCMPGPEGGTVCLGRSGSITRISGGRQQRIITRLPSIAATDGSFAIGPSDVSIRRGRVYATIGLGADPRGRSSMPRYSANRLDTLLRISLGATRRVADIGAYEVAANPDGGEIDSNANAVVARRNGWAVVDAGGNALLWVDLRGRVTTLAVFPGGMAPAPPFLGLPPGTMIPYQPVPTSVVVGPDGAYYVGQLTGFPFPKGEAKVWRVVPGRAPTVYASGFTNIIDIAFRGRTLYVLEIAHNGLLSGDPTGALIRVRPDGGHQVIRTTGLEMPGGMAVGPNRSLYISNRGTSPGQGQVLRYTP